MGRPRGPWKRSGLGRALRGAERALDRHDIPDGSLAARSAGVIVSFQSHLSPGVGSCPPLQTLGCCGGQGEPAWAGSLAVSHSLHHPGAGDHIHPVAKQSCSPYSPRKLAAIFSCWGHKKQKSPQPSAAAEQRGWAPVSPHPDTPLLPVWPRNCPSPRRGWSGTRGSRPAQGGGQGWGACGARRGRERERG